MLSSYKEIVYGLVFGFGAALLDTMFDARAEGQSFLGEIGGHPVMMIYRLLFVFFGLLLGWLLWRNNKRQRDVRLFMEQANRFFHEYEARTVVLHTNLQVLLTKGLSLPPDCEALLRTTYDQSRDLQAFVRQRPTLEADVS